jgi:hypothetical protein
MASQGNEQDNTDATFDILFRGDIAPGNSVDQVKARVAESFKLDEVAINQLFSGAVVSLKRNIDRATAERIFQRLADAGALANIVPSTVKDSTLKESASDQSDLDHPSPDNLSSETTATNKSFTLAPLGSDVIESTADLAKKERSSVSIDHLGLEPIGSDIVEQTEREAIEPVVVDTSHITLE